MSQPITVTVQAVEESFHNSRVGRHTRMTKGKKYTSPRLFLPSNLNEYIGTRYRIFKAKVSVTGNYQNLQDKDALIVVLLS